MLFVTLVRFLNTVPTEFLKVDGKAAFELRADGKLAPIYAPIKISPGEFGGGCGERPLLFDMELSVNSILFITYNLLYVSINFCSIRELSGSSEKSANDSSTTSFIP